MYDYAIFIEVKECGKVYKLCADMRIREGYLFHFYSS